MRKPAYLFSNDFFDDFQNKKKKDHLKKLIQNQRKQSYKIVLRKKIILFYRRLFAHDFRSYSEQMNKKICFRKFLEKKFVK